MQTRAWVKEGLDVSGRMRHMDRMGLLLLCCC